MYAVVRKLNSYNIQILCVDGEYRFACNVDDPAFDIKRFESRDEAAEAAKDSEYAHVETFYDAIYNARVAEEKGWRRHVKENLDSLKNSEKIKLDTPRIMAVNKENITECCVENEYIFKKIMITHVIIGGGSGQQPGSRIKGGPAGYGHRTQGQASAVQVIGFQGIVVLDILEGRGQRLGSGQPEVVPRLTMRISGKTVLVDIVHLSLAERLSIHQEFINGAIE